MAARRPAKIASKKKGSASSKECPTCASPMQITKVLRTSGPSGMFWVCTDVKCGTTTTPQGVLTGKLQLA